MRIDHVAAGIRTKLRDRALARGLRVGDRIEGELHRLRIERRAVVETHVAAQLQRHALAIRRDVPRRRQARKQLVRPIAGDQRVEHLRDHLILVPGTGDARVIGARRHIVLAPCHRQPHPTEPTRRARSSARRACRRQPRDVTRIGAAHSASDFRAADCAVSAAHVQSAHSCLCGDTGSLCSEHPHESHSLTPARRHPDAVHHLDRGVRRDAACAGRSSAADAARHPDQRRGDGRGARQARPRPAADRAIRQLPGGCRRAAISATASATASR